MAKPTEFPFPRNALEPNNDAGLLRPLGLAEKDGQEGFRMRVTGHDGKIMDTFMDAKTLRDAEKIYHSRLNNPSFPHSAENLAAVQMAQGLVEAAQHEEMEFPSYASVGKLADAAPAHSLRAAYAAAKPHDKPGLKYMGTYAVDTNLEGLRPVPMAMFEQQQIGKDGKMERAVRPLTLPELKLELLGAEIDGNPAASAAFEKGLTGLKAALKTGNLPEVTIDNVPKIGTPQEVLKGPENLVPKGFGTPALSL